MGQVRSELSLSCPKLVPIWVQFGSQNPFGSNLVPIGFQLGIGTKGEKNPGRKNILLLLIMIKIAIKIIIRRRRRILTIKIIIIILILILIIILIIIKLRIYK